MATLETDQTECTNFASIETCAADDEECIQSAVDSMLENMKPFDMNFLPDKSQIEADVTTWKNAME